MQNHPVPADQLRIRPFFVLAVLSIALLTGCSLFSGGGLSSKPSAKPSTIQKVALSPAAQKLIGKLTWPVPKGGTLGSRFGPRKSGFHDGVDIRAKVGTPFLAAHAGEVIYSGSGMNGYGNMLIVRGADILSVYAHNQKHFVSVGRKVKAGDKLGLTGDSGRTTGPHLHFEIRVRNKKRQHVAVDPLVFFPTK